MRIHIDLNRCAGHAQCAARAAEVFELDDLGYALRIDGEVPDQLRELASTGAAACPERAITIGESPA